jgi:glycosyltransferase involved in cell wall biosynthesis
MSFRLNQFLLNRVKLITRPENGGIVAALNEGINVSRGNYIARMDADDVASPDRLMYIDFISFHLSRCVSLDNIFDQRRQYNFLREHSEVDIVGGAVEVFDSKLKPNSKSKAKVTLRHFPLNSIRNMTM